MTNTRASSRPILTPDDVANLVVLPTIAASVAGAACTVVHIGAATWRIPRVTTDPSASWVAEGEEIPVSDMALDEVEVTPAKLAGLNIVTSELAQDSSPSAVQAIGAGLVRDLSRKVDAAFLGNLPAPAPKGLASLTGTAAAASAQPGPITNFDVLTLGLSLVEQAGASVDTWLANPTDIVNLSTIKSAVGSAMPIMGVGDATPGRRSLLGVPLLSSPHVPAGTIWGIPKDRCYLVVREDATVDSDSSTFFTSDRIAVRAKMRIGFGFPHEAAIVKVIIS